MEFEEKRKAQNKYRGFVNLLLYFLEDTYLNEGDDKVIEKYVKIFDGDFLSQTLKDGREVLGLDPFPHEWIGHMIGGIYFSEKDTKEWVEWMMVALEAEAKRVGKL